jgi:hypothetical protein
MKSMLKTGSSGKPFAEKQNRAKYVRKFFLQWQKFKFHGDEDSLFCTFTFCGRNL